MKDKEFNDWLDTFVEEKEIDLNEMHTHTDMSGAIHLFETNDVINLIKATSDEEKAIIKNKIISIDFNNGDIVDFLKFLFEIQLD